jgi:hypothetical protein
LSGKADVAKLAPNDVSAITGKIPYRMAFAGGWIDQPFISRLNPKPPGSMVVVGLEPDFYWMGRCGMACSTRSVAMRLWGETLPKDDPASLVRALYNAENEGRSDPSGSQDMVGLIYPGVNRLDFDADFEGGVFPCHIESNNDPKVARWLERVIHVLPIGPRPPGYNPLGEKHLDPQWIARLGRTGKECYDAIVGMDEVALGKSMNDCMECWEAILPRTVRHPGIPTDLVGIQRFYGERYAGAMYSGCGGGYLYVVAEEPVPGSFNVRVRTVECCAGT